jgi:hypothetical protein
MQGMNALEPATLIYFVAHRRGASKQGMDAQKIIGATHRHFCPQTLVLLLVGIYRFYPAYRAGKFGSESLRQARSESS